MTVKKFLIAIALVTATGLFANAQTANPPSQVAPIPASRLKAAFDLLTASGLETKMDAIYSTMLESGSAQIPADKKEKFKDIMKSFLAKYMSYNSIKDDFARIYAEEFTEQELKDIAKFYATPAGKKVNEKLPSLMQKGMMLGQTRIQAHLSEFEEELKKAFPDQ